MAEPLSVITERQQREFSLGETDTFGVEPAFLILTVHSITHDTVAT